VERSVPPYRRCDGEKWGTAIIDYLPHRIELVRSGTVVPSEILTQREPMTSVIDAYKAFDKREPGWIKVMVEPVSEPLAA
jgi:threonine dehydrogenase-like Zn-dependent dehydrogenase